MLKPLILLGLLVTCTVACAPVDNQQASSAAADAATIKPADAASTADAADVKVELASHAELMTRLETLKGKVVVVDVWSTSCLPCMREFPNLVALSKRFPEDVACVSFNVDYLGLPKKSPDDYVPGVKKFLDEQKAALINMVSTEADSDVLEKFDVAAMPAILVYDRAGALVAKLTDDTAGEDGLTYKSDVLPLVESLARTRPAEPTKPAN